MIRRAAAISVVLGAAAMAQQSPETYQRLLANDPNNPQLLSNFGVSLFMQGGSDREALIHLRRAVEIAPDLAAPNLFAGLCLTRLGEPRQALPFLDRAYRIDRKGPLPALALARVYVALRDYRAANRYYAAASERDSSSAEAWYGLGITYRNLLDWTAGRIAALDETRQVTPPRAAVGNGSRAEILSLLAAAGGRGADRAVLERLARVLRNAAVEALSHAVALEPDSERAHLLLAEAARDQGNLRQAVAEYDRAIRLKPDLPASYIGLATAYWKAGVLDDVVAPLEQALQLAPNDPEANGILADVLTSRGDYARAREAAETALQGNPALSHARVALARIDLAEGRPAAAVGQLQQTLTGDTNGSRHYLLHRALKQLGRGAEAAAALERFRQLRARAKAAGEAPDRSLGAEP